MKYKQNKNVEMEEVEGQTLIFDSDTFKFFELNETSSFIWKQLEMSLSIDEIVEKLVSEFAVEKEAAKSDVRELILTLKDLTLVLEEH